MKKVVIKIIWHDKFYSNSCTRVTVQTDKWKRRHVTRSFCKLNSKAGSVRRISVEFEIYCAETWELQKHNKCNDREHFIQPYTFSAFRITDWQIMAYESNVTLKSQNDWTALCFVWRICKRLNRYEHLRVQVSLVQLMKCLVCSMTWWLKCSDSSALWKSELQ